VSDVLTEPNIEELIEERDNLKERLMRSLADLENQRKRADRDRKDAEVYGGTKLARDLLSVFDNMSRALDNIDDELRKKASAVVEGLELTQRELLSVFSKHKIDQIEPVEGDKFDPKYHQAMFEAPVSGTEKGTIIQVMTKGFKIGDRLLRAAQVGVSSNNDSSSSVSENITDEDKGVADDVKQDDVKKPL
jgi:molecular chaperone GrpE